MKNEDSSRLLADFPPQMSEMSLSAVHKRNNKRRKSHANSQAHSDDEVEVRRGLESEHVRTDMGSNPELCQSTHSLPHHKAPAEKAEGSRKEEGLGEFEADRLLYRKPVRHGAESNDNLISDEIDVNLSRATDSLSQAKKPEK